MIRQNRAVPIMLLLTLGFILWVGGCLDSEGDDLTAEPLPTPVPTSTPAPVVSEAADNAPPAEEPFTYTIEEGDLLDTIAAKFNVDTAVIRLANPSMNPSVLFIGQELKIPGATTEQLAIVNPEDRPEGEPTDYVVKSGDTMGAIANTYVVSSEALMAANPTVDAGSLQIGQLLSVPPLYTGLSPDEIASATGNQKVDRLPNETLTHVVKAGDLLSSLADIYSVDVTEIMFRNSLTDANEIYIGQELLIPPPSDEAAVASPATPAQPATTAETTNDPSADPTPAP